MPGPLAETAVILDAFSCRWDSETPYVFPPVQIIDRVLQKIQMEKVTALLVVPKWPSQPWWTLFCQLAKSVLELGKTEFILSPGPAMTTSSTEKKLPPGLWLMALVGPEKNRLHL
jgi:hypothetical protein